MELKFNEQLKFENEVVETMGTEKKTADEDKLYYSKNTLKWMGWTERMIKDFLGEPDVTYAPSCAVFVDPRLFTKRYFYLVSRVEEIEKTKAFKERKQAIALRRERRKANAAN
jgi:hypothetical protein